MAFSVGIVVELLLNSHLALKCHEKTDKKIIESAQSNNIKLNDLILLCDHSEWYLKIA